MMVYGLRVNRLLSEDLDLRLNQDPIFSAQTNETNTTNLQPEIEIYFFLILMTATMAIGYRHFIVSTDHISLPDSKGPKASHCNQNTSSTLGSITGIWVGLTRTRTSLMSSWPKLPLLSWNGVYLKIAEFLCWQRVNQSTPTLKEFELTRNKWIKGWLRSHLVLHLQKPTSIFTSAHPPSRACIPPVSRPSSRRTFDSAASTMDSTSSNVRISKLEWEPSWHRHPKIRIRFPEGAIQ